LSLLVGFVSKWCAPELCLGILEPESGRFGWLRGSDLLGVTRQTLGVNGICRLRDHWVIGFFATPTTFAVLDKQFRVVSTFEVPEIKDVHSFCHYSGDLLTVSTGTDEVLRLKLGERFEFKGTEVVYRASSGGTDVHHVNSVAAISDDRILATQFGRKHANGWVATREGTLFELPAQRTLLQPLHHPHTAHVVDGEWVVCESGTGKLHFERGEVVELGGYVRGLAHDSTRFYVGVSGRRLRSRSEGTTNMGPTNDPNAARCGVHVCTRNPLARERFHDLSLYATEIYELVMLSDDEIPKDIFAIDPRDLLVTTLQDQVMQLMRRDEDKGWKHDVKRLIRRRVVEPTKERFHDLKSRVRLASRR
jgi:hypothetical protein